MIPRCQIKWIDKRGNETPDISPAAYIAVCKTLPIIRTNHFLCCEKHFQQGKGSSNWEFISLHGLLNEINTELAMKAYSFLTETLGA
jgi:hypothetical protein